MLVDPTNPFADLVPASDAPGVIYGPPKTKEPKTPVFVPQGATQMYNPNTGAYEPVPQTGDDKDAIKTAIEGLGVDELLASLKKAHDNLKTGWATGTWGAIAELKPGGGTPRDDFLGHLTSIQGGIINEKLAALKELSKNGASGLGALSEKEGERLASSVAALTTNMSQPAYEDSFREIARHAETLRAVRDGKDPRDPETKKAIESAVSAMFPSDTVGSSGGGGPPPPGAKELNDEQKRAYTAFLKVNPTPTGPQIKVFLEGVGVPNVGNSEAIADALKKGGRASTAIVRPDLELEARQKAEKMRREGSKVAGAVGSAALALPSLFMGRDQREALGGGTAQGALAGFADEAGAAVTGLGESLAGRGSFADRYAVNSAANNDYLTGLRERNPGAFTVGEIGGGATTLALGGGALKGSSLARVATERLGRAGANVAANTGYGALYGFGSNNDNRLQGAVTGGIAAAAGGALGEYAIAPLANRMANRLALRGGRGMAPDVAEAARAENVDLMRPMVDPKSISDYGALESNIYSQPIIRGAAGRIRGQIEDRTLDLGKGGTALEPGAAGDIPQTAGNRFITRSRGIKNRLYDRAENLGGTAPITTKDALGQIDQELTQLGEAPDTNRSEIAFLEGLKNDLSRPQTVGSIRRIRTSLRGQINQANLTATSAEARAMRVLDAAKNDIQRDAPPAAANAYSRADAFNRERQTHIDTVLRQFLGKRDMPLDSEKAFARLKALASPGGGGRNLAAMMRNLESDERQDIAATIANSLGRDAVDAPFSTAKFVSQTSKLSPSARRTIFGPDGAQSIDNLRLLARKLEEAEKDINRSRSATVLERQGWRNVARGVIGGIAGMGGAAATGSVGGGVAGLVVASGAMGASAARRVLSARALVNPRVSRWLAQTADVSTEMQAKDATRKLGVIIGREPAVAGELKPIYDFLQQRLEMPLAAQPQPEGGDNYE